jgi:ParB family chromosome partitioning protein
MGDLPHGARFWPQSAAEALNLSTTKATLRGAAQSCRAEIDESLPIETGRGLRRARSARSIAMISTRSKARSARSFDAKKMKSLGCIVDVEDGRLVVLYGIKKPVEAKLIRRRLIGRRRTGQGGKGRQA